MLNYIERLQYICDNTAEVDDRKALEAAIQALRCLKTNNRFLKIKKDLDKAINDDQITEATKDLVYPEHEWIPCTFREILNNLSIETWTPSDKSVTCFNFKNEILDKPLHILEDDGMGYGAFNIYATSGYIDQEEARIWI